MPSRYDVSVSFNIDPRVIFTLSRVNEIVGLLNQALAPKVTFSEDMDEMRDEAQRETARLVREAVAKLNQGK